MDAYLIPVGGPKPEASWALIESLTDKDANRLRSDIAFLPPARKSQWEHWAKSIPGKNLKSGIPTDAVRPDPNSFWHADAARLLNPIWQALFDRNELSVPDALRQAREAMLGLVGPSKVR
jgi:ABC-type glycerol-3-phosphate transport system substrate-binding protein